MSNFPHTWHRSHNASNLVREAKLAMNSGRTVDKARGFVARIDSDVRNANNEGLDKRRASELISELCNQVESASRRASAAIIRPKMSRQEMNELATRRISMGSMIFPQFGSRSDVGDDESFEEQSVNDFEETVKVEELYQDDDYACFTIFTCHLLHLISIVGMLYGGAWLMVCLDPGLQKYSFVRAVLTAFDGGARLGWGQLNPKTGQGKLFLTVYSVLICGLVNGFIARIGSIITDIYCVHWPVLVAKIKGQEPKVSEISGIMSVKVLLYIYVIMAGIAMFMWGYAFESQPMVDVVYFTTMSMMAASFGDIHPNPANHFQLALLMAFMLIGIAIWGAILVIMTSYVDVVLVEECKEFLRRLRRRPNVAAS